MNSQVEPQTRPRVLVIEDEAHLAAGLKLNLELEGYRVANARTIRDAAAQLLHSGASSGLSNGPSNGSGGAFDLILLDIMLPDGDGFAFCKQLRDAGNYVPVIMLTARGGAEDRIRGLDTGADDYLAKPFELPELLARVRSALRRRDWQTRDVAEPTRGTMQFGRVQVNFDTHEVTAFDKPVRLTQLELDLLYYFSRHPRRVLTREELLERVWHLHNSPNTRSVDNFIVRLRKYFEPKPDKPVYFVSHRGAGYKFVPDGKEREA